MMGFISAFSEVNRADESHAAWLAFRRFHGKDDPDLARNIGTVAILQQRAFRLVLWR
jgi:hypothetical protein